MTAINKERVLSGMRPTGALHLGHYHGAIKNWTQLQHTHECYFFVADWHALTTHSESHDVMEKHAYDMVIDWLACGLDPDACTLFLQSRIPEHAELFTLLAMGTPLSWLERVPTYKDQQERLKDKDLATYGFLGYPLLQAADILIYKAHYVPVGEDQASHVELTREAARHFNHLYGREANFDELLADTLTKLGKDATKRLEKSRKNFQETGDTKAREGALGFIASAPQLDSAERERLMGWFKGTGRSVLTEPQVLLTKASKLPGLDGQKMSKSYGNAIAIREDAKSIEQKIRTMPTDPARVKLTDKGNPNQCPVWQFHVVYSDQPTQDWAEHGCKNAAFGCLTCKKPVIDAIVREQKPMLERAASYIANPKRVRDIIDAGTQKARIAAQKTMTDVRTAMGLNY